MAQSDIRARTSVLRFDESLYSPPAESDKRSEQMTDSSGEHISVNMEIGSGLEDQMIMDELTCAICAQTLIDPISLNCGHSFCQLCLATMWLANGRNNLLQLQCPVCQQPWKILPEINTQLR